MMNVAAEARWKEIRARSLNGSRCCGDCYMSFFHGIRHLDGGGYPCPKHATADERREVEQRLAEELAKVDLNSHPLMQLVRRSKPAPPSADDPLRHVPLTPGDA